MTATDVNHRAEEALEEGLDSSNGECESIHGCDREVVWLHHWTCKCFPNGQLLCDRHRGLGEADNRRISAKYGESWPPGPEDKILCDKCFLVAKNPGVYTPI